MVAAFLEPMEDHDGVEVPDMEAFSCWIETDIGGLDAFGEFCVEIFEV